MEIIETFSFLLIYWGKDLPCSALLVFSRCFHCPFEPSGQDNRVWGMYVNTEQNELVLATSFFFSHSQKNLS